MDKLTGEQVSQVEDHLKKAFFLVRKDVLFAILLTAGLTTVAGAWAAARAAINDSVAKDTVKEIERLKEEAEGYTAAIRAERFMRFGTATKESAVTWKRANGGTHIDVTIDTSSAGFSATPSYFTSVSGNNANLVLGSASFDDSTDSQLRLRLYLKGREQSGGNNSFAMFPEDFSSDEQWTVNWVGIEPR